METKELLGARYRLERRLASGGMGDVWAARDELLGRSVALKLLHPHLAADGAFRQRFRTEAQAAARLSHPGIVGIFDYGEDAEAVFLAMELVEGEPLQEVLRREGAIGPAETMSLVAQAADALAAAHRAGLVHRDVKPANLLVRTDGRVKVTDFGIVRATGVATMTHAGTVLGTVSYMSPEQVRGELVTPASDLYSLGVVAFECLAGRRPFAGGDSIAVALAHLHEPVPALPGRVTPGVRQLVTAMLRKDPRHRPGSAAAVARTARRLAGGAPTGALPQPVAPGRTEGHGRSAAPAAGPREQGGGSEGAGRGRPEARAGTERPTEPFSVLDPGDASPGMTAVFDLRDAVALAGIARHPERSAQEARDAPGSTAGHDGLVAPGRGSQRARPLRARPRWARPRSRGTGTPAAADRAPRHWLRVAGIAGSALVGALLLSTASTGGTGAVARVARTVAVPPLDGLTVQQAEHRLLALGLRASTGRSDPSPSDRVRADRPRTGTRVRRGSVVVLEVNAPAGSAATPGTTTTAALPPAATTPPPPAGTGRGPGPDGNGPPGHDGTGPPGRGP